MGADTGSDTEALVGIDADRERSPIFVGVDFTLGSELELVGTLIRQRKADPAPRLPDHEIDHLGRDELRRANEVALVLAILIVSDDDELAGFDVADCLFDCSKLHEA